MTAVRPAGPPPGPTDRSASIVRAWVALYTRRLPVEIAADRRDLIEADLWDEVREADLLGRLDGVGRQRLSRLIRGIPADLTWRFEQRGRGAPGRDIMRITRVQLVVLLGVAALLGLGLVASFTQITFAWPEPWVASFAGGLLLALVGNLLAIPRPAAGLVVAVVGTLAMMAAMPWAFFLWIPVPLAALFRFLRDRTARSGAAPAG